MKEITISIVSHNNESLIEEMLKESSHIYMDNKIEILIRENKLKSSKVFRELENSNSNIKVFFNKKEFGFGRNQNLNFKRKDPHTKWFIVCNPDLKKLPDKLELGKYNPKKHNVISGNILNEKGLETDFIRSEVSYFIFFLRFLGMKKIGTTSEDNEKFWFPNVFTIFNCEFFKKLNGYDENIFLYYEDYDICMRARKFSKLYINKEIKVLHKESRKSRKNLKFLIYHLKSIFYIMNQRRNKVYI